MMMNWKFAAAKWKYAAASPLPSVLTFALLWCTTAAAQEPAAKPDEALDSLLEKIAKPGLEKGSPEVRQPAQREKDGEPGPSDGSSGAKSKTGDEEKAAAKTVSGMTKAAAREAGSSEKDSKASRIGAGDVSAKDKDLDLLLEKLGQTSDEPAADKKPRSHAGSGEPADRPEVPGEGAGDAPKPREKAKLDDRALKGKDKEIDDRLEELTGRKRKKKGPHQEDQNSPLSQIIKEMRDVQERLSKPDSGEDTQSRQKRIVKQIETLIQQMRQSGSSGAMVLRRVRQDGQKPANQPGQTPGSTAGGAPPMKPAKPSDRHALAAGKDIWGHLPPELRQEMENGFKEDGLPAKEDLIRRYYLSVAKQKLVRGE
ncbi:MAG: hypothetical protein ACLP7Q_25050 [Isosphaeraceae bacterium]